MIVTGGLGLSVILGGMATLLGVSDRMRGQLSTAIDGWAEEETIADRVTEGVTRQLLLVSSMRVRGGVERWPEFRAAGDIVYAELYAYLLRDLTPAERLQLEAIKQHHQELEVTAARATELVGRGALRAALAAFDSIPAHGLATLNAVEMLLRMREAGFADLRRNQDRAFWTMHVLGGMFGILLLIGTTAWGRFMYARVDRPLADLAAAARRMEGGDLAARVPDPRDTEFGTVAESFNTMAGSLADALEAARRSEDSFRHLFATNPLPMWVYDLESLRFLEVNDAAVAHYGYDRDEFLAMRLPDIRPPEDVPRLEANLAASRGPLERSGGWRHRLKDGRIIDVEIMSHLLAFRDRRAALAVAQDITRRKRAETALRASEERYRGLIEHAVVGVYQSDLAGMFLTVNPALVEMLGYASTDELMAVNIESLYLDPSSRGALIRQFRDADRIGGLEVEWKRKDGRPVTIRLRGQLIRKPDGTFESFEMFAEDVTAQRAVEAQLRQSQKMEAVGQLTGGIAHDFNNLLTVILSYARMALDSLPSSAPLRGDLQEVHDAGVRAAQLTRQLLAFSRRQMLKPVVVNLNEVVAPLEQLLRRVLGELIAVEMRLAGGLGNVNADPGQLEQVVVNLAVNARDAMPDGGKLTIESGNVDLDEAYAERHISVTPGRYVRLSVTDTGTGMSAAVRERIFEPFFTTKEEGKGTGLGLATVYGIVKQSGGSIWVYSEPGHGTTFKIYLPRVDEPAAAREKVVATVTTGTETILIAEDEEAVRRSAERILSRAGYRVLTAGTGDDAISLCERHRDEIALLLTDVVMPKMSGRELQRRATAVIPALKVLFMSGYADEAVVHHGVLDPGIQFIGKPFSVGDLRSKVREVLDAPTA